MASYTSSYTFSHAWTVPAPAAVVRDVVVDLEHYPSWWPQVRAVAKVGPDDARVLCRSALPYTLDLLLSAVSKELPVLEVSLDGDLDGTARFRLTEVEGGTRLDFEQEVRVSGLLRAASAVGRPLLEWNHHRMMRGCVEGLTARLRELGPQESIVLMSP